MLVTQAPFALAVWFAVTEWNLLRPNSAGFIGFDALLRNFRRVLTNPDLWTVLWNTLYLTGAVVVTFALGMAFALLLNRPFPGWALARTMLISPFLMMPVAASVLWKNVLLDPGSGLAAWVMRLLGLPAVYLVEAAPCRPSSASCPGSGRRS